MSRHYAGKVDEEEIKYRNITIEGNIGVGKTTAARNLGEQLGGRLLLESFENNPFLELFYGDADRYAFQVELFFLAERYHQLSKNLLGDIFQEYTVADYLFVKSSIFSSINLNGPENELFLNLFRIMDRFMPRPDILIYLHIPAEKALENIKKRGRAYEQAIPLAYLKRIEEGYFNYLKEENRFPIVVIDESENQARELSGTLQKISSVLSMDWKNGISYFSEVAED